MNANNSLSEKLDEVMGKLNSMEKEFTLQMGKYEQIGELEDRIDMLEKRVKKLEQPTL